MVKFIKINPKRKGGKIEKRDEDYYNLDSKRPRNSDRVFSEEYDLDNITLNDSHPNKFGIYQLNSSNFKDKISLN